MGDWKVDLTTDQIARCEAVMGLSGEYRKAGGRIRRVYTDAGSTVGWFIFRSPTTITPHTLIMRHRDSLGSITREVIIDHKDMTRAEIDECNLQRAGLGR
jgi:hypothetical protein